jgi:hypothetical protein
MHASSTGVANVKIAELKLGKYIYARLFYEQKNIFYTHKTI